jgi:hypothetical protein
MTDERENPPVWDPGSDGSLDQPRFGWHAHSSLLVILSALFGIIAPFCVTFVTFFALGSDKSTFGKRYPFSYPGWSLGITIIKMYAMIWWLRLYSESPPLWGRTHRLGAILAGVLFVGGMHAVGCGITAASALGEVWLVDIVVQVIWMSPVAYLLNFVMAIRWVIRRGGHPARGFLIGVAIAVVPPALLQSLIFGFP